MQNNKSLISNDVELLELIVCDAANVTKQYQPAPYWKKKSYRAARELVRYGLDDFRGTESGISSSFGDNTLVNLRNAYRSGRIDSLKSALTKFPGFKQVFEAQVKLTEEFFRNELVYKNEYLWRSKRVQELISKYQILSMDTTRGGCVQFLEFDDLVISHHYLKLLDTLDVMLTEIDRTSLTGMTTLEIGGGFGVNTHLMIELFGARKIVYLDISPNLYVGTQYLKSFYGTSVIDYRKSKNSPIRFQDDNSLEIFCILPHQIENIEGDIDLFHNAHSFVEMSEPIVRNYASKVNAMLSIDAGIAYLVSYDGFDPATTLNPDFLNSVFESSCMAKKVATLIPGRQDHHFCFSNFIKKSTPATTSTNHFFGP